MGNIAFWKISFFQKVAENVFWKSWCCVEVPASKCISSVDIFIWNNSSVKKVAFLKNNCPKELLFSKSGCLVEVLLWKINYSEKITASKKVTVLEKELLKKSSCSEEIAAPKKYLFCRSSYSEKVWINSFPKNKTVLKMSQHMGEGKSPFEKEIPN